MTEAVQELVEAVALAERPGATKAQRKAAFEAQTRVELMIFDLREALHIADAELRRTHEVTQ